METLKKIAKALNVPLSKLLGEINNESETDAGIIYGKEIDKDLKKIVMSGDDRILKILRDQLNVLASMIDKDLTRTKQPSGKKKNYGVFIFFFRFRMFHDIKDSLSLFKPHKGKAIFKTLKSRYR